MKLKKHKITIFAIAEGYRVEMHSVIDIKMPFFLRPSEFVLML